MHVKTLFLAGLAALLAQAGFAAPLATYTVGRDTSAGRYMAEGNVEAVRQSSIASQVPGQIRLLAVREGDRVGKGQVLVRLDDSAASQNASASRAMIGAATAQLTLAQRDYQRQQQLFADGYISQSAMDRAKAQYQAARAATSAQASQAGAASATARFYTLTAPYSGLVSHVSAIVGDMAMPGQRMMIVYDPSALKIVTNVPQSILPSLRADSSAIIEAGGMTLKPSRVTVAPGADLTSHTVEVRLDLQSTPKGLVPGTFARVAFVMTGKTAGANPSIPVRAVVTRSELTGVYVMSQAGRPMLRQVRLGNRWGSRVEVLSGLSAGDTIALDPLAAAKMTAGE
jgi:membrane fusion protein, multidrug efflux system